jgi:hypothetical protein
MLVRDTAKAAFERTLVIRSLHSRAANPSHSVLRLRLRARALGDRRELDGRSNKSRSRAAALAAQTGGRAHGIEQPMERWLAKRSRGARATADFYRLFRLPIWT